MNQRQTLNPESHPETARPIAIAQQGPVLDGSTLLALLFLLAFSLFLVLPVGMVSPLAFTILFVGSFFCFASGMDAEQ